MFFFKLTATSEIYTYCHTLSLPDALPLSLLWVGKRAKHKTVAPGKLDHLVAGGQPYGLGLMENVIKESAVEASVPAALAALARPVGAVRYICDRTEGRRNAVAFCFDPPLPAAFRPQPNAATVATFPLYNTNERPVGKRC